MAIEVYTGTKPAAPYRAVVVAVALLAGTCLLALKLVRARDQAVLGPRVEPDGWGASIRPPLGFELDGFVYTEYGPALQLSATVQDQRLATMLLWQFEVRPGTTAVDVCNLILQAGHLWTTRRLGGSRTSAPEPAVVGPLNGVEILDAEWPALIRAAVKDGKATAVSFHFDRLQLTRKSHELFDLSCRTVRLDEG